MFTVSALLRGEIFFIYAEEITGHIQRRQDQLMTLPHALLSEKNYSPVTSPAVTEYGAVSHTFFHLRVSPF